jgi:hypothetical protein
MRRMAPVRTAPATPTPPLVPRPPSLASPPAASLNPTVSFGKARDAPALDKAPRPLRAKDRTASGRIYSGRPTLAGQAHGHRAGLLLRPLAPIGGGAAGDA